MNVITAESGKEYTSLPIDNSGGFPQSFSFLFEGKTYHFWLYVDIATTLLDNEEPFIDLPVRRTYEDGFLPPKEAFLVVQVEREAEDGTRGTIFLRKVLPELEYETENIALIFPEQHVARENLNGQGDLGSQVTGGIARRWE